MRFLNSFFLHFFALTSPQSPDFNSPTFAQHYLHNASSRSAAISHAFNSLGRFGGRRRSRWWCHRQKNENGGSARRRASDFEDRESFFLRDRRVFLVLSIKHSWKTKGEVFDPPDQGQRA